MKESLGDIEICVEIKHTWRGDLSIILKPPGQNDITLQNRTGGGANDFIRTFRSSDQPALFQNLINTPAQGDWILKISDHAERDDGVLIKWGIAITY